MNNLPVYVENDIYATTGFISVAQGQHVKLKTVCPTTVAAVTLYDENQVVIDAIPGATDTIVVSDIEFDINDYPTARYIRLTGRANITHNASIVISAYTQE